MAEINLRNAVSGDEPLLLEWRNIGELVSLSYLKKKVTPEEHHQWFCSRINSDDCLLLIVQLGLEDIGLVRIESEQKGCEVSIYLIPGYEGKGYGSKALALALEYGSGMCNSYSATIQSDNVPSMRLFEKMGFHESSRNDVFVIYSR